MFTGRVARVALGGLLGLCAMLLPPASAAAPANTFFFHGTPTDQANKANPPGTATFDQRNPTGATPVTQTGSPQANRDFACNPLAMYWSGPSSGALSGVMQFNWFWSSANATAILLGADTDVTIFADPDCTLGTGTIVGRATVHLNVAPTPTANTSTIPVAGTVKSTLLIQAVPHFDDTGQGLTALYDSTSTPSGFGFAAAPPTPAVTFDTTTPVAFAPATIVSPSFLGGEPELSMERPIASSQPGRIDPQRIFVDWPLSSRTQTSQVSRSLNGGDSFRLLADLKTCPERNRPNCQTGGGGDSKTDVNLYNGNLFFADQEVVVNEAVASSTDHGDSWPLARQFAITNTDTAVDRQWLAFIDPSVVTIDLRHVEAFLAYHLPLAGQFIQGIDQSGLPIPQPAPQILGVLQSGSLRVDNSSGPAHGWIYQPYRGGGGVTVGTAAGPSYQLPNAWQSTVVSPDSASIFPWLDIDSHGNAYLVWVTAGNLFLSVSPIDDPRNNPSVVGGRPGRFWTQQVSLNPPGVTSTVFPEVAAGDTGRIAIAFMGTTECSGLSDNCAAATHWNSYAEILPDVLALARGTPLSVNFGTVSHRVNHRGAICTSGTTCTTDRSLLDMIDLKLDQDGRVGVVFTDNNNRLAAPNLTDTTKSGPFAEFAKETQGPSLRADRPAINVVVPANSRTAAAGDATWPNTAAGTDLRSMDLLGASLYLTGDGSRVIARIPIQDATLAGMARDLNTFDSATTEPGARLQYVLRFSTADDVFHMDMDYAPGSGALRFFGGRLDSSDGVQNGTGTVVGARYVADPAFSSVTGSLRNGTLTLSAPKAVFGLDSGSQVFSVSAFSMAGPTESDPTATLVANSMRTVDATPPFDATLQPRQTPPTPVDCTDRAIQEEGGWHTLLDTRAGSGTLCRNVNGQKTTPRAYMQLPFYGTGVDVIVAKGPRGGNFNLSIDGGPPTFVDLYRPPTNPAAPDRSGRVDLDFGVVVHVDVAAGTHVLRIDVLNNSAVSTRNMVYVDGFAIYNGDASGVPGPVTNSSNLVSGLLTSVLGAEFTLTSTANTVNMDTVLAAAPGVTVAVKDPTGTVVASGTVEDGVLALQFGPHGIGAYTIDVGDPTGGQVNFDLWEIVESP